MQEVTRRALDRAHEYAVEWLESLPARPVPPRGSVEQLMVDLGPDLPDNPVAADETSSCWPAPATPA